jgi:hypothetical protein
MHLNRVCFEIYTMLIAPTQFDYNKYVIDYLTTYGVIYEDKIIALPQISVEHLLNSIRIFIQDYLTLMNMPQTDSNYIVMPINYLLHGFYDGVCNAISDTAASGSVYYNFPYRNARSFVPSKKSILLKGHLIYNGEIHI